MNSNVSIVTDTARDVTVNTVIDYGAGVFAHINGDYDQHSQARIYDTAYIDEAAGTSAVSTLRLLLTDESGSEVDLALIVPVTASGTTLLSNAGPIITQQPANAVTNTAATAAFTVGIISDTPVTFQWQKSEDNVNGATAISLVIPSVQASDVGIYRVVATNSFGSVVSSYANLTIDDSVSYGVGVGLFDQILGAL